MNSNQTSLKVMSIDDEEEVTTVIAEYLGAIGFDVRSYNDSQTAYRALIESSWLPDVILADIMMPGMDGYELAQRILSQERLKNVPVLFLSGKDVSDDSLSFLKAGGQLFIKKPFKLNDLQQLVTMASQTGFPQF
jgi:CheY-like chemotaxis protein